jgi:hypothetical protein
VTRNASKSPIVNHRTGQACQTRQCAEELIGCCTRQRSGPVQYPGIMRLARASAEKPRRFLQSHRTRATGAGVHRPTVRTSRSNRAWGVEVRLKLSARVRARPRHRTDPRGDVDGQDVSLEPSMGSPGPAQTLRPRTPKVRTSGRSCYWPSRIEASPHEPCGKSPWLRRSPRGQLRIAVRRRMASSGVNSRSCFAFRSTLTYQVTRSAKIRGCVPSPKSSAPTSSPATCCQRSSRSARDAAVTAR